MIKEKNLAELDEAKIKKIHAHAIMHIMAEQYMINPSTIPETLVNDVFRMYLMFMEFQFLVLAFSTYNSLAYDNPPSIFQPVVKYLADMPPSPSTKLLNKMLVFLEGHLEKQGMPRENINVKMSMVQNMQHSPVFSHVRERLVVLYLDHMEDKVVTHEIRKVNPLFHTRLLASMDRVKEFARRDYVLHASPWYMDAIVQYLKSF